MFIEFVTLSAVEGTKREQTKQIKNEILLCLYFTMQR